MPADTAEIRYDPVAPPVAVLAAAEWLALAQPAAASASAAAPAPAKPHVQLMPTSGSQNTLTLPENGQVLTGTSLLLRYLGRVSTAAGLSLAGRTPSEGAQIDFFLDLAPLLGNKDTLNKYAAQINDHLAQRTVLVGDYGVTLADFACWEALTANPRWSAFVKAGSSAQFPHLFRWHTLLVNQPALAPSLAQKQALEQKKAQTKLAKSSEGSGFDVELPGAAQGKVVTRFPPEPSGYLHIGHAKAAMLNDAIAKKYNGKLILRFDDTNPQKEKEEYVENIMADLKTIGVHHHQLTHTSDHFDLIQNLATQMIQEGKAYVDDTPVEQMRKWRMDGVESPNRNASVEVNMALWKEMQDGTPKGLACCMRAKIDMSANNKTMRDPVMYRCNVATPHHRTGTKYKVYPTYDFACPIVDSIEGVTHCLRTDEYRDRNEQFYWMCDALRLRKPYIRDYSRLNFVYTVLSKRKLQWFVDTKRVDGWSDARFPTIQGILRRGMKVEALREFILGQGFSMSANIMEWDKIWTINKRIIDPVAPRYTGVTLENAATLELTNYEAPASGGVEVVSVDLHPKDPKVGAKAVTRSNRIIIEQDDAKLIKEGEEVTLMNWGNVIVKSIESNGEGIVTRLVGDLHLSGDPKTTSKKLTWLDGSAANRSELIPLSFIELDTLVTVPKVEEGVNFESIVNPKTKYETPGLGEAALRHVQKGDHIQISRRGFFIVDALPSVPQASAAGAGAAAAAAVTPMQLIFIPDGRMKQMSTLSTKVDKAKTFGSRE